MVNFDFICPCPVNYEMGFRWYALLYVAGAAITTTLKLRFEDVFPFLPCPRTHRRLKIPNASLGI